ncbi:16S rRNA (guanine(966)-N(2))-methyltransferase RsmD [Saccharopolyspora sp. HNM0983]|uniref:16S rRNA (Guanine(966)-N(2))-methyltransferase RsmD n=1 Tax=Saccharopolyspora montiporae TaxID=2781240 RepID=A0A929BA92_9PSEU|nr:16S rRNA (guanine(966)-N(2))-methyltransferase RsmD [Saccharopolyspora sp. HNM0983]
MTRIVAGTAGGRRIEVPQRGTRPTSDRVREALFSSLESTVQLAGARVLDLYAGSGALGLEALSRGAARAVFVESDRRAAGLLRKNVTALGLPGAAVLQVTARTALAEAPDEPCDVVLCDPPYDVPGAELAQVLELLVRNGWTAPGTLVVVERSARGEPPDWPEPLRPLRSRRYGETEVHRAEHGD